jgi:hypothetical protein
MLEIIRSGDGQNKTSMPPSQETLDLIRRGELIYEQRLKAALESTHRDYFVAIEPDSGDYFLGQTLSEAAMTARQKYPDRRTYLLRVGHPTAVHIGTCQV